MNSIDIRHYAFKSIKEKFPLNWNMDPYKNKNWVLNFMSLRWILDYNVDTQILIIKDFYDYFYVKKNNQKYITTIRGDHAAAIRIKLLISVSKQCSNNIDAKKLIDKLLSLELNNAMQTKMYRAGHNHALMLDNSLLDMFLYNNKDDELIESVVNRGISTAKKLYSLNGITREHSISYQEYNLPIIFEFFEKIKNTSYFTDENEVYIGNIRFSSLLILSLMLNSRGEYFAIGDTLRSTKPKIIESIFGYKDALITTSQNLSGIYCLDGFFVYKKYISKKLLHFVSTTQWNSFNHKQDDEFSFCLEFNGRMIFDHLGYSGFLTNDQQEITYSYKGHSTFFIKESSWKNRSSDPNGSNIDYFLQNNNGFFFKASHLRMTEGCKCSRDFSLFEKNLLIKDSFENIEDIKGKVRVHRFVLGPSVQINIVSSRLVQLKIDSNLVATIEVLSEAVEGEWRTETLPYVESDSREISNTRCIDFENLTTSNSVDFLINLVD